MAKICSDEWRRNVSKGLKNKGLTQNQISARRNNALKLNKKRWGGLDRDKNIEYIKNKMIGRIFSEETLNKMSKTRKRLFREGKIVVQKPMLGKKHTEEFKINMGKRVKELYKNKEYKDKMKEIRSKLILPFNDTKIELKIQGFLTIFHIEYLTHKHISEITNAYQCDIFIPVQEGIIQKIVIECDGCFFHCCPICKPKEYEWTKKRKELDDTRTQELQEKGFRVIRLWEHEINSMNLNEFKEKIKC